MKCKVICVKKKKKKKLQRAHQHPIDKFSYLSNSTQVAGHRSYLKVFCSKQHAIRVCANVNDEIDYRTDEQTLLDCRHDGPL